MIESNQTSLGDLEGAGAEVSRLQPVHDAFEYRRFNAVVCKRLGDHGGFVIFRKDAKHPIFVLN